MFQGAAIPHSQRATCPPPNPQGEEGGSSPSSGPPSPSYTSLPNQILASVLIPSCQEPRWDGWCRALTVLREVGGCHQSSSTSVPGFQSPNRCSIPIHSRASLQASLTPPTEHSFLQPPELEGFRSFQLLFAPFLSPSLPSLLALSPSWDLPSPQPPPSIHLPDPEALTSCLNKAIVGRGLEGGLAGPVLLIPRHHHVVSRPSFLSPSPPLPAPQ